MDIKENLATNLINFRKAHNLTQAELAKKLNYSDKAVSKWERGESAPDLTVLYEIANFYGTTIDKLISNPQEVKVKRTRMSTKKRSIVCLIGASFVWLLAILSFAITSLTPAGFSVAWLSFIYAVPLTLCILCIFFSVWKKSLGNLIILSLLVWTIILSVFLSFRVLAPTTTPNIWLIFLIGIPVQLLLVFWYTFKKVK